MGSRLTWEWRAPSGETVSAALELPSKVESVWLGPRLLSRSPPGGQGAPHPVPLAAGEARVEFNAEMRGCVLLLNGTMVPPTRVETKGASSLGIILAVVGIGFVFLITVLGALAYYGVRKYNANVTAAQADAQLTESYPSKTGLLVAHYPADFAATVRGEYSLQLTRGGLRDDSILLVGVPTPVSEDLSELSRVALKPILDAFASKNGSVRTLTQGPSTCLGSPGYSTTGVATIELETVDTWSCTFIHDGHGYVFFTSVNQSFAADAPLLRRIVDATVLTEPGTPAPAASPVLAAPQSHGTAHPGSSPPKKTR